MKDLSKILISYFEIQYDNLLFKSAAFLLSRVVMWAACYIPRVWPIQICFHFYSMTTRVDAIKKRNSLWLCKSYNQIVTNQQGILVINALCAVKKDQIKGNKWRGVTISLRTGGQGQPTLIHAQHPTKQPFKYRHIHRKLQNARFLTFRLVFTDWWTDRRTDRQSLL